MEDGPVLEEQQLSYIIRGSVYEVFKCLGCGFLENVYENALLLELKSRGLHVISQAPVKVNYKDTVVGNYIADIVVENRILLELKAQRAKDKHPLPPLPSRQSKITRVSRTLKMRGY